MKEYLSVGDTILWSSGHGTGTYKPAIVENIEFKGKQYGVLSWEHIWNSKEVIIDLDNGHWCYGKQIKKNNF